MPRRRPAEEGAAIATVTTSTVRWIRQRRALLGDAWRVRVWPPAVLAMALAVALGIGLPYLDSRLDGRLTGVMASALFGGGPRAARTVLSTIAGSLVTVTSLTFSLTVVTLQLASTQYSPRILRTFVRDQFVQGALALLLGTFVYAITVLRSVRSPHGGRPGFVPELAVTVAFLLVVASVVVLVLFLAHLARQIRVESMLTAVESETVGTLRRSGGDQEDGDRATPPVPPAGAARLCGDRSGFLTFVEEQDLLSAAASAGAVVVLERMPGEFLVAGTPLATAWRCGHDGPLAARERARLEHAVRRSVRTGFERTAAQDTAFGLRQIVDVTLRALSPGINDPTTATHALDHAAVVLCEAARTDPGPRLLRDEAGRVRVVVPHPDLAVLLDLAVAQPCRYGAGDPEVLGRLLAMLRDVASSSRRAAHLAAVSDQLDRVRAAVRGDRFDELERRRLDGRAAEVDVALAAARPGVRPVPVPERDRRA